MGFVFGEGVVLSGEAVFVHKLEKGGSVSFDYFWTDAGDGEQFPG